MPPRPVRRRLARATARRRALAARSERLGFRSRRFPRGARRYEPHRDGVESRLDGERYTLSAPTIDLTSVAALLPFAPERSTDWPARAALQGQLHEASLRYASRDDFDIDARLDGPEFCTCGQSSRVDRAARWSSTAT